MAVRKKLILVTGASGFIGAHIVEHLLQAGYAVRGTCRSPKASSLRIANGNPDFEVVIIDDLVHGDFTGHLRGVHGVIHVASPLLHSGDYLEVAVHGTMNLLRQVYAAHIHKITIISSFVAAFTSIAEMLDTSRLFTNKDWNKVTKTQISRPGASLFDIYSASKTISERAAWSFARSHPSMELVTLLPCYVYGPIASTQVATDPQSMLSTNGWIYTLLSGSKTGYPQPVLPHAVDVRDVATAAVNSLHATSHWSGPKRVLLWGSAFTSKQALEHIAKVRPSLRPRLMSADGLAYEESSFASIDNNQAMEIIGMTGLIGWREMIEDTVDSLLEREMTLWT